LEVRGAGEVDRRENDDSASFIPPTIDRSASGTLREVDCGTREDNEENIRTVESRETRVTEQFVNVV
jgi:hypothetical protein